MQFTAQQMQGGPKYAPKTRVGNWSEELYLSEARVKDFLSRRESGSLASQAMRRKREAHFANIELTSAHPDGLLHFGDVIMLHNAHTNFYLSTDLDSRIADENRFGVTSGNAEFSCARNSFVIERVEKDDFDLRFAMPADVHPDAVRFGQRFRIALAGDLAGVKVYLASEPVSQSSYSPRTHKQEVYLTEKKTYASVWKAEFLDPQFRLEAEGMPLPANASVLVTHCGTQRFLASDKNDVANDFGREYEVMAHSFLDTHNSGSAKTSADLAKPAQAQNIWAFTSAPPAEGSSS